MRKQIIAGVLAGVMAGMTIAGAGLQKVNAEEYLGVAEIHAVSKDGGYEQELQTLPFGRADVSESSNFVRVHPDHTRQTMLGVGGAITESAAYNILKLSKAEQNEVYEAYFG